MDNIPDSSELLLQSYFNSCCWQWTIHSNGSYLELAGINRKNQLVIFHIRYEKKNVSTSKCLDRNEYLDATDVILKAGVSDQIGDTLQRA